MHEMVLGFGAVALLVFLTGAARAKVIPADFRCAADRLGRFDGSRAGLILHLLLLALLAALDFFR
jgi:hypothetical protein